MIIIDIVLHYCHFHATEKWKFTSFISSSVFEKYISQKKRSRQQETRKKNKNMKDNVQ